MKCSQRLNMWLWSAKVKHMKSLHILHVLKYKLENVNVTAWLLHRSLFISWLKCSHYSIKTRLQLGDVMNPAAVHALLQLPSDPVVYWTVRIVGWPGSWSDEVWCFNNCTVFTRPVGTSVTLSTKVTSEPVTALHLTETNIIRCRYVKINNSTVNEYFNEILRPFQTHIQTSVHIILLGCVKIWHFYPMLSVVYFFPGHSVFLQAGVG